MLVPLSALPAHASVDAQDARAARADVEERETEERPRPRRRCSAARGRRGIPSPFPIAMVITWIYQKATAISPLARNAAGRVNSPTMIRNPQTVSTVPAAPCSDISGTAWPPNKPATFCSPKQEEQQAEHDAEQRVGVRGVALWNHESSLDVAGFYPAGRANRNLRIAAAARQPPARPARLYSRRDCPLACGRRHPARVRSRCVRPRAARPAGCGPGAPPPPAPAQEARRTAAGPAGAAAPASSSVAADSCRPEPP